MADWSGYWDGYYGGGGSETGQGTTLFELKRQVFLCLGSVDGVTDLRVEQAINNALRTIAMVKDFDELMVLDVDNCETVAEQKSYHIIDDLLLTQPKDIYSVRYMDEGNSRKLKYVEVRELDEKVPYTELTGYGRPTYYTRRGFYIELYRIPDEAKSLYIQYSQWPAKLTYDDDRCPYLNINPVIVELSVDIAVSMMSGSGMSDWALRAQQLLGIAVKEEGDRPDRPLIAQPFMADEFHPMNEYWLDPFYKGENDA